MRAYYQIIEALNNSLSNNNITQSVTIGDITEVDLNRRTIFPLAHIVPTAGAIEQSFITIDFSITFADVVDISDENAKNNPEPFLGHNNLQDVHNTQLAAANLLVQSMLRGDLWDNDFKVTTSPTVEPFQDRFENTLAGWVLSFQVEIRNTDTSIC